MSTPCNFDGYSEFCDWCGQNGYGDISREGLTRKVEKVVVEKVSYVSEGDNK